MKLVHQHAQQQAENVVLQKQLLVSLDETRTKSNIKKTACQVNILLFPQPTLPKSISTFNFSDQHLICSNLGPRRTNYKTIIAGYRRTETSKNRWKSPKELWFNSSCTQKIQKSSPKPQENVWTVDIEQFFFL